MSPSLRRSRLPRQCLRHRPRRHRHRRRRCHLCTDSEHRRILFYEAHGMMDLADCERQQVAADGYKIGTEIIPPTDTQVKDPWLQQSMNPYFKHSAARKCAVQSDTHVDSVS